MKIFTVAKILLLILIVLTQHQAFAQAPFSCGTSDSLTQAYLKSYSQKVDLTTARTGASDMLEYRLALDVNYDTYLHYNKDKKRITETAYSFVERASVIFEREMNIKLTVVALQIWDEPEPYALVDDFDYFNNVNTYWLNNRSEPRDAVVSLSMRNGWFFGGYRMCSSNFPDYYYSSIDVDVLAHELGHTLGSPHTHNCLWPGGPIDRCNALESTSENCVSVYNESLNGSIMSYCRNVLSFHPLCRNLIRDFAEGKVNPEFKLNALNSAPAAPQSFRIAETPAYATPAFTWQAPLLAGGFNLQIARDAAFTQVVEDEMPKQSYFQSYGLAAGNYFARVKTINAAAGSAWSGPVNFTVPPFSENAVAPMLFNVSVDNEQNVSGNFKKYDGIQAYQVQLTRVQDETQSITSDFTLDERPVQSFSMKVGDYFYGPYKLMLRVKSGNVWSQWSEPKTTLNAWYHMLWDATNLQQISSEPVLATQSIPAYQHQGLTQEMEIATDAAFKNVVYRQSEISNQLNERVTNKVDFMPKLSENTAYHLRTRMTYLQEKSTNWKSYQLTTGMNDQRFQYLGSISKGLMTTQSRGASKNRFYPAGNKMYVFDLLGGYFSSENLKDWRSYSVASTGGMSSDNINIFGASETGSTYLFGLGNQFVESDGTNFKYISGYPEVYFNDFSKAVVTNDGMFFKTANLGVGRLKNGIWTFYDYNSLFANRAVCVEKDRDGRIWAVMAEGQVYSFSNEKWTLETHLPQWDGVRGLAFDKNRTCYAYGDWGVSKLNTAKQWETISIFSPYAIQKIIFDADETMWMAAYRYIGIINQDFADYALIKYKNQKASIYSDGLNFLKEPFDIEFFNNKLLILTNGGELQTFEENKIQRFTPKSGYCPGAEVTTTITSNSTFGKGNVTSFQLKNVSDNKITTVSAASQNARDITLIIPDDLADGTYTLKTLTTEPELSSNESAGFKIQKPAAAKIEVHTDDHSKTTLTAVGGSELTYQWLLDGVEIPGASGPVLETDRPGSYSVSVVNAGGCVSKSAAVSVVMDLPTEVVLMQNVPNPVQSKTAISFYLPEAADAKLELFNVAGQKLGALTSGTLPSGWHKADLDAGQLASGIYVYRLTAGDVVKTLKMIK